MNCESKQQIMPLEEYVKIYIETTKAKKWEEIDEKLIPQITEYNGDEMAKRFLGFTRNKDSNIRDGAATAFSHLDISDPEVEEMVISAMQTMATVDKDMFASGRAAVYLMLLNKKEGTAPQRHSVVYSLDIFKKRAVRKKWVQTLKEEIIELNRLFT